MKHIYTFFFWLVFPLFCSAQSSHTKGDFEGVITYSLFIESKNPTISTRQLQAMFGDTMKLYLKDNNYKMLFSGTYAQEILYSGKENKHFILLGALDSMVWRSCSENASSVVRTRSIANADYVLDYACDAYCIQTDWGFTTYYYSPELKLNPRNFSHHIFNYFNIYVKHARAPYLKYVYNGPTFKLTLVATEVKNEILDQTAFNPVWEKPKEIVNTEIE